jgi:hypothetical protein
MPELTVSQVGKNVQSALAVPAKVITDPDTLQKVLKVALNALKLLSIFRGMDAMPSERFGQTLDDAIEMIDAVQVVPDGIFLSEQKLEKKNALRIGWISCFFTADIVGLCFMLEDYKLFDLTKHAAVIGGKHIVSNLLNGVVAVGYAFKLADIIVYEVGKAETTQQKARCAVSIIRCIVEIAAKTFAVFGPQILFFVGITAAGPTLLIVVPLALGAISAGLGIAEFFLPKVERD